MSHDVHVLYLGEEREMSLLIRRVELNGHAGHVRLNRRKRRGVTEIPL